GEDYELVFAVAAKTDHARFERTWQRAFPRTPLSRIGHFVPSRQLPPSAVNLADYRGYEHLR
ncbi:MAG TPA: thiamine-monophosphate kinase, partial [Opitutus sp.]|nr:thiamine-monophosphate kinase [Opitutus sp.]